MSIDELKKFLDDQFNKFKLTRKNAFNSSEGIDQQINTNSSIIFYMKYENDIYNWKMYKMKI